MNGVGGRGLPGGTRGQASRLYRQALGERAVCGGVADSDRRRDASGGDGRPLCEQAGVERGAVMRFVQGRVQLELAGGGLQSGRERLHQ